MALNLFRNVAFAKTIAILKTTVCYAETYMISS